MILSRLVAAAQRRDARAPQPIKGRLGAIERRPKDRRVASMTDFSIAAKRIRR